MGAKGYMSEDDFLYSLVFGGGIYQMTGETVQDPLRGDDGTGQTSPLLSNIITGEVYFAKRMEADGLLRESCRRKVLVPPRREHILWPSDMIDLGPNWNEQFRLFLSAEYTETPTPPEQRGGGQALLFPYGGYPVMMDVERWLQETLPEDINWMNPEIQGLAREIVGAFESVNRDGYIYSDVHLSRILLTEEGKAYLDHSNLIYEFSSTEDGGNTGQNEVREGDYPLEFAEPFVQQEVSEGRTARLDFEAQNYSLAALLFFLFFGRYCYEGKLVSGRHLSDRMDISRQEYYSNFRYYHKTPVFIFDPGDTQNNLGIFDEDKRVIGLWNQLPDEMKGYFYRTLREPNALRQTERQNPTPGMWLNVMRKYGWNGTVRIR